MKFWPRVFVFCLASLFVVKSHAQTSSFTQGSLKVSVFASNPCNGGNNGSIRFTVQSTGDGLPAVLVLVLDGGTFNYPFPTSIAVGSSFTLNSGSFPSNPPASLSAGNYGFFIRDNGNVDVINTLSSKPIVLTALPSLAANQVTLTNNSDCATPNGQVVASISGGSQALAGGGSYTYTWTSNNGLSGLPLTNNNFDGLSNLDLAALLSRTGLPGGTYTLAVQDNYSSCTVNRNFTISDPLPNLYNITSGSGTACSGANFTVTLNSSDGPTPSPGANYEILRNGSATGLIFPGTGSGPFNMTFATGSFSNGDVLTVRASNGFCTPRIMTGSVTLGIASAPTSAVLSGANTICAGQSTNLSVAITGGTAPFSFTISGLGLVTGYASGAPISVTPASTTTYTLSGTVTDANGCTVTGSGSALVTVNPIPTATISASPNPICSGSTATLLFNLTGSGPFNVTYNDGSSSFSLPGISNGATVNVTPAATTTYTITAISDASSCIGVAGSNVTVTVNPKPTSATISGTATICAGQSTNISVAIVGGTPPYSFNIANFGAVGGYISGSAISVSPASTTTYSIVGNITDASGCTVAGSGSAIVTVNPRPVATVSASPTAICSAGGSSTLTFTLTGSAPFNVSYSDGTSTFNLTGINSGQTVTVSPSATTTYTITSVSDATICTGTPGASATVTVNPSPTAAVLSGNATICAGTSTNLVVNITSGTAPFSFTITGLGLVSGYTSGANIPVSPVSTTNYSLSGTVTDANGCVVTGSGSASVTVNPAPTAAISSSPGTLCSGGTSTLTFTLTGLAPFNVTYSDGTSNFNLTGISSGHTVIVTPAVTTTYTIISVTDANTCNGVAGSNTVVNVNPSPTSAALSGTTNICVGQSTNLSVNIVGGVGPFNFTIAGIGLISSYTSGSPIPVSPISTTSYSITGVVTDANGCSVAGSGTAVVTVQPLPTATISGGGNVCFGSPLPSVTFTFTGTAPFNFTWSDGTTSTPVTNHPSTTFTISNAPAGTYSINALSDANTCNATSLGTPVSVIVSTAITSATLSGGATICNGQTTNLVVNITGGTAPYSFTITGLGVISNYNSGANIPVSPSSTTTYTLSGNVTDAIGCTGTGTGSAIVNINPAPTGSVGASPTTICNSGSSTLTFTLTGTAPFNVSYTDGTNTFNLSGISNGHTVSVSPATTTTYTITSVTDGTSCPGIISGSGATVSVSPAITSAVISGTATICSGASSNIVVNIVGGTGPYDFNIVGIGAVSSYVSGTPITITPAATATYTISGPVTDALGCTGAGSGSAVITVNPTPASPTVSNVTYCQNDVALPLTAVGSNLLWYTVPSGGIGNAVAPTPSTVTAGTTSYYVTQTVGGCESARAQLDVIVNPSPASPSVSNISYCVGAVATPLTATGANLLWYTVPSGGVGSAVAPTPSTASAGTTSYYVTQTVSGCESTRAQLDVTVSPVPSAPTVSNVSYCVGGVASPLTATGSNLLWYAAPTGGVGNAVAPTPSTASAGTTSFYVTQTVGGCESTRAQLDVTVSPAPASPSVSNVTYCVGAVAAQLTATGTSLLWYTVPSGGVGSAIAPTPATAIAGTTSYYVTQTVGGCESTRAQLDVIVNALPASPTVANVVYCVGDVATQLTATGTSLLWYTASTGGVGSVTAPTPTTAAAGTTSYFVTQTVSGCESARAQIDVTVSNPPSTGLGVTAAIANLCVNGVTTIDVAGSEINVNYQLRNGATNVGSPVAGTGGTISLSTGVLSSTTTFNVLASNVNGTCTPVQLTATATVNVGGTINSGLTVAPLAASVCSGSSTSIRISLSENGVNYQLRDNSNNANIGSPLPGNGGNLDLPTGNLAANTTFNILASNGTCSIVLTTTPSVTVVNSPDVTLPVSGPTGAICPNTSTNITVANAENGVSYQLRSGSTNIGSPLVGSGANLSLATNNVTSTTTFSVQATRTGCPPVLLTATVTVNLLPSNDPSCGGGGGVNCGAFTISVTDTRPTCNNQNNGQIVITVSGGSPNYVVTLSDASIGYNRALVGNGPFTFGNPLVPNGGLSPSLNYQYTVKDQAGNTCTQPYSLPVQSTVQASASTFVDAQCNGKAVGSAKITIASGGTPPYEYSIDGGTTYTGGLVSGNTINNLPPNGTYNILIRDDASDQCPATVSVTINNANPAILATTTIADATCANNDGSVTVNSVTGGIGPYTYRFDSVAFSALPTGNKFDKLTGGIHKLTVIDSKGCEKYYKLTVNFPGFVNTTAPTATSPTCNGQGLDGTISFTILNPGAYTVGYTTDPVNQPTVFVNYNTLNIVIPGLSTGDYYVWIKPSTAVCATKLPKQTISGSFSQVSFDAPQVSCNAGAPEIRIANIKAGVGPFTIQLTKSGQTTPDKTITLNTIPAGALYVIKGTELPSTKGDYVVNILQPQGTCVISSSSYTITYNGLLNVSVQNIKSSYPDLPTGGFDLINFVGGTKPYFVTIRFDSASNPKIIPTDFEPRTEEVTDLNNALQYVKTYNALNAGRYHLTVTENGGCSLEFDVRIPIDVNFDPNAIPNVFTPNNDGSNDTFYIRNIPPGTKVNISSRWGAEVFSSSDYQNDWTGNNYPDGVYFYRVSVASGGTFTGWVEIIRGK